MPTQTPQQLNQKYASFDWQIYKAFVEGNKDKLKEAGVNVDFISQIANERAQLGLPTLDEIVLMEKSSAKGGNFDQLKAVVQKAGKEKDYEKDFKEMQQLLDLYTSKEAKQIAQKLYDEVPNKLELLLKNADPKGVPSETIDKIYTQIFKTEKEGTEYAQLEILSAAIGMYSAKITQRLAKDGILPKDQIPKEILNLKEKDIQDFKQVYHEFKLSQLEHRYGKAQMQKAA